MTDIRRSILWIVFSVSLVMLWDAWNTHSGHPSMFAPTAAKPVAAAGAAPASAAGVPAAVPAAADDPKSRQEPVAEAKKVRAALQSAGVSPDSPII